MFNDSINWSDAWIWSLPLILFTVPVHAFGLLLIRERIILKLERAAGSRRFNALFAIVMGATVLLLTILHGFEGGVWALAYLKLGALTDIRSAMLYSLSAMTSYGHADLFLAPLAVDGRARSPQWHDAIRFDDRFPVLRHPDSLASPCEEQKITAEDLACHTGTEDPPKHRSCDRCGQESEPKFERRYNFGRRAGVGPANRRSALTNGYTLALEWKRPG